MIKRRFAPYFEIELLNTKKQVVNVVWSKIVCIKIIIIIIIAPPTVVVVAAAAAGVEALSVLNCCASYPPVDCAISGTDGFSRALTSDRY